MKDVLKLASQETVVPIKGTGSVKLEIDENAVNLQNSLYVPKLNTNLMSVGKITDRGYNVLFDKHNARVVDKRGNVIIKARRSENGLYYLKSTDSREKSESSLFTSSDDIKTWHRKMGHLNETDMKLALRRKLLHGFQFNPAEKLGNCEICIQGKFSRLPFRVTSDKRIDLLHTIHSDVCGPCRVKSPGGARYFVTFIDEYSRYSRVFFLKQKNEVFKSFQHEVERSTEKKIKHLQSDNGTEYCNSKFDAHLRQCGIRRRLTAP